LDDVARATAATIEPILAARVEIDVVPAADSREIEGAFTALARDKVHALVVGTDPFFAGQRVQLVTLAMRHALPTVYNVREYAEAGA
jgi:putative tryptophan/tyrosine transport system substrate-binding protein